MEKSREPHHGLAKRSMMDLHIQHRKSALEEAEKQEFDLIVIGGGITGAGIALDAISRGISTLLVEKSDFASGTSSRSTKLIHGGLRYLKQGDFMLVREVGLERAIVHRNAPHLVIPEKMIIPLIENGNFGKWATSFGLWVYDKLANVEEQDRRKMLTREATLEKEPLLNPAIVQGSGYYAEYRTDDARLTMEVIKKAVSMGAYCFNYVNCTGFEYEDNGIVKGITAKNVLSGKNHSFSSKVVVNATGPWVDDLRKSAQADGKKKLHLTKGVHLVFKREKFPVQQSVYFDAPDGRMIFAIPRDQVTYLGTTDTNYKAEKDEPAITLADVEYLLHSTATLFPNIHLTKEDIISSWAGLRPLIHEEGKSASELSRKDEIFEADNGLLSIAGGKLTGYRKMAERITDKVAKRLLIQHQKATLPCQTADIPLTETPFKKYKKVKKCIAELKEAGLSSSEAFRLTTTYGKAAKKILAAQKELKAEFAELATVVAEYDYCLEQEACYKLWDFYRLRTGRVYFYPWTILPSLEALKKRAKEHWQLPSDQMDKEAAEVQEKLALHHRFS